MQSMSSSVPDGLQIIQKPVYEITPEYSLGSELGAQGLKLHYYNQPDLPKIKYLKHQKKSKLINPQK